MQWFTVGSTFLAAMVLGTFVEYWGHRLMHTGALLKRHHARHHQHGTGQGWLREFRDYGAPSVLGCSLGFLVSPSVGVGAVAGAIVYAAIAAWSHQLQHELPHHARWMRQPQHAVHHYHREWHHNFGMTVDWWDRVFGTYREHPPLPRLTDDARGPLAIHWVRRAPPLPKSPRNRGSMSRPGEEATAGATA